MRACPTSGRAVPASPRTRATWANSNGACPGCAREPISSARAIKLGLQDCLYLGNLESQRDWGHARDYVEAMWLILQQRKPEDFVIATGLQYSVRDFVRAAAHELGIALRWEGSGVDEKGYDDSGRCIVFESTGDMSDNTGSYDPVSNPPTGFTNADGSQEVF